MEFLTNEAAGRFRKSFEMVAEDSKDYYFSISKEKATDVKITSITYSDYFRRAEVGSTSIQDVVMPGAGAIKLPAGRSDRWRLEKGVWMWFHDPHDDCGVTLVGRVPCGPQTAKVRSAVGAAEAPPLPEKITPELAQQRANALVNSTGLDKTEVNFVRGTAATSEIVFHNDYTGMVRVLAGLSAVGVKGITVSPNGTMVRPKADLTLTVTYSADGELPAELAMDVVVEPFGTHYRLPIRVAPAGTQPTEAPVSNPQKP